jgi:hypothetical protein
MSFSAEEEKLRQVDADGESSRGMTQLVKVNGAAEVTASFRTPETATAALGTARGVRVREAEEWAAGREKKKGEGGSKGRKRGRGAQLRRQLRKMRTTMDNWRRQQTAVQPGAIKAELQRYGCTRLLRQRSEAMLSVAKLEKAATAMATEMGVLEESVKVMRSLCEDDEQRKIRELRATISSLEWSVRHGRESLREAAAAERRLELRFDDFKKGHAREKKGWRIENEKLKEALQKAKTEREAELCGGGVVGGAAEAGPGTTRKLAVDRPAPAGTQKRLRMDAGSTTVEAESEAVARVEEAAERKLEELRAERNKIEDELWAEQDKLIEFQQFVKLRDPGAPAAWLARGKEKKKK